MGGTSLGMVDDIVIDGVDMSDGINDKGYGYCRPDDYVTDTVCAGEQNWELQVPFPIPGSDWSWTWLGGTNPGIIDADLVPGEIDSLIQIDWGYNPGVYVLEATEIRPPYLTTTYSVEFTIYVLDYPEVTMVVDSVCEADTNQMTLNFVGDGPWTVTYSDGTNTYTETFTSSTAIINLPTYATTTNNMILDVVDSKACHGDTSSLPNAPAVIYPRPGTGPIYH